jgi:hypothetical protein
MAHAEVSRVRIENRAVLVTRGPVQGKADAKPQDPNPKNSPLQGPLPGFKNPIEFCFYKWTAVIHLKRRGGTLSVGFLKIRNRMHVPLEIHSLGTVGLWWCHVPSFVES